MLADFCPNCCYFAVGCFWLASCFCYCFTEQQQVTRPRLQPAPVVFMGYSVTIAAAILQQAKLAAEAAPVVAILPKKEKLCSCRMHSLHCWTTQRFVVRWWDWLLCCLNLNEVKY